MPVITQKVGHPKGLYVLFATEMWERLNYYGMRAVLVLFMTQFLLFDKVFASHLYGSYTGLVYLTPLVGGYIADRFWGNRRAIVTGGILMALGEFLLFGCAALYHTLPELSMALFFSGLGLMIVGNGFFKPNISSMVGQLYPEKDKRIDGAYTIFYMGINAGGALGPVMCGYFGDTGNPADFKWSFLVAGIGMLLGTAIFVYFKDKYIRCPKGHALGLPTPAVVAPWGKSLPVKTLSPMLTLLSLLGLSLFFIAVLYVDARVFSFLPYVLPLIAIGIAWMIFKDKALNVIEKERIAVIFVLSFFVIFFWSAFEQAGASLTFFADEQTNRNVGHILGYKVVVPASAFQSLNAVFVIGFAPIFAWLWLKLGKQEPSSPVKMAMGLFLLAIGYLVIAFGVKDVAPTTKVSMIWLTSMYAFHTFGELCLSPIGMALVNKLAPLRFASLLMAVYLLANAAANKLAGVLSGLYPDGQKVTSFLGYRIANLYDFFMLFVLMALLASLMLFLVSRRLLRLMH